MREHDWERQILDGGHLGGYENWECRRCGATSHNNPEPRLGAAQFYACGCGAAATQLPADCDAAQSWITEHRKRCPRLGKRSD